MSDTRSFHLGDILSVTTGRLVAPGHIGAVHELLDYMTGDTLFTHQVPRAAGECEPELLRQHPDLADIEVPDFGSDPEKAVADWLSVQVGRFGEHRTVAPLNPADHTRIDPVAEFALHYPAVEVIPVTLDGGAA
jgi:hypothetical protein